MWVFFFFFSSRRRHTRLVSDWSSDVCSSDLIQVEARAPLHRRVIQTFLDYPPMQRGASFNLDALKAEMAAKMAAAEAARSEERRVGKEWRSTGWPGV